MRFELRTTSDGSLTVFDSEAGECYKSRHAARLEVETVFIRPGIRENPWHGRAAPFRVLELGFGLGTNFLALAESGIELEFVSIERDLAGAHFFLKQNEIPELSALVNAAEFKRSGFSARLLTDDFFLATKKLHEAGERFHSIFFDPFSPKANPESWTTGLFLRAHELLHPGGRLVTYSVCREAKDAATSAGFEISKHKLPDGLRKRSALLATKAANP